MKSFFEIEAYQELQERIDNITIDSNAQWGKMNGSQMLNHCQAPIKIALGKSDVTMKSNWLIKVLFKKMMYSPKPFKKNAPTPPQFRSLGDYDFNIEKIELQKWMNELWEDRNNENRVPHPVFGDFTKDQWGIMQWKHLNHHFEQFGV
ncbi:MULTISPECIES: DUF1569 domain-containing protein [Nonlabens]|uniref:DUF1569 domain-containing protein n=1 Tax=Nonlabens TaxID=363408 RepID=UPI0029435D9E|nr:DUF1569 domain-containing protein [Nonlabens ulvanivorans]WOI22811.1 DUF1569 domain-containing protein [Nonlabens ulvanivorans]